MTTIVWFRQDLRVDDHAPLLYAAERGAVVPIFLWSPEDEGAWPVGAAARWWLHHSLTGLAASLQALGSRLIIRSGRAIDVLPALARESGADVIVCARRYEPAARAALTAFLDGAVGTYAESRDIPAAPGTSRLSPHLHWGEISPRRAWHAVSDALRRSGDPTTKRGAEKYLAELLWREFAHHVLVHFPHTPAAPLRAEYASFPWRSDLEALRAWQRGRTGYPLVDAGMRELWATGWMHNRVRMVVASFLVKHLLIAWHDGARWFWDTLVDADLANNTLGWQWAAGCGADAAPYFRIFNPVLQGEKFDPTGTYVRRWVPELALLPDRFVHAPWKAPAAVLERAGVRLGVDYPAPIVEHTAARIRALAAADQRST